MLTDNGATACMALDGIFASPWAFGYARPSQG